MQAENNLEVPTTATVVPAMGGDALEADIPDTPLRESEDAQKSLKELQHKIEISHGAEMWPPLKMALAVIAALSFDKRANPLVVIIEGASGRGKSFVVNICEPDRTSTQQRLIRLDSFTPKSFVSHAANKTEEALKKIDLLPQIKDKVLLNRELAPLFRGRDELLRENFAILTSVLDGKGYRSASGAHRTRGYAGRFIFNMIGATTPIPPRTDAIMAQLGNRMFRYEMPVKDTPLADLADFAESYVPSTVEDEYRKIANDFIEEHFKTFPLSKVDPSRILLGRAVAERIALCALLISDGRVEVTTVQSDEARNEPDYIGGTAEGPHRVILGLRLLAQALALISSRQEVTQEDMDIIHHIAFSSLPSNRRRLLRAVVANGGSLTSPEAEHRLGISRPTARNWMKELTATGIVSFTKGTGNEGGSIKLAKQYEWLLDGDKKAAPSEEGS